MRHVALLNLITQCKDNLKENMYERNILGVSAKKRDHEPRLTKHTIYMSWQNGVGPSHELMKEGTNERIEEMTSPQ
jgi:hypothetical protein